MRTSTERDRLAPAAGDERPAYSCPKSPRRFTPPRLLACRVLRAHPKQADGGSAARPVTSALVDRVRRRLAGRVGPVDVHD